jgi:aldose 1-epimerase
MPFAVKEETRAVARREYAVVALTSDEGARAELWPALGCNCLRWQAGGRELVYAPDPAELIERPTRGGVPVLFPFPNRIRDGHFAWAGHDYRLPRNDSTQKNAIHGLAPRKPWDVTDRGASRSEAWLTAEFEQARWQAASHFHWPAEGTLRVTIRLSADALRYEAEVTNTDWDGKPYPFGLGYHPYFAVTPRCRIQTPARARWELVDTLPTGRRLPLEGDLDLRQPRPVADLTLDDVYTDFLDAAPDADGLVERGRVEYPEWGGVLRVLASPTFRELVLFTPPHRQAVCLEPYTCPTDAIHLQAKEDVGWRVLAPGEKWEGAVEYRWSPL